MRFSPRCGENQLRKEDLLAPDIVFRDPYLLDFLGLKDTYRETDFEAAIIREMESFILELGVGFSFVARPKRISVDDAGFVLIDIPSRFGVETKKKSLAEW